MHVLCCTFGTHDMTLAHVQTYFRLISPHTFFFYPERIITFPDIACKSWNPRLIWSQHGSEGGHAGGPTSCSNICSGGICTFWAAVMCWSGAHVFLFMCTPTHKLTWCIDVYVFFRGHKNSPNEQNDGCFLSLVCSWWLQFGLLIGLLAIVWSDQIINVMEWQCLCWQTSCFHNESFCACSSLRTQR